MLRVWVPISFGRNVLTESFERVFLLRTIFRAGLAAGGRAGLAGWLGWAGLGWVRGAL